MKAYRVFTANSSFSHYSAGYSFRNGMNMSWVQMLATKKQKTMRKDQNTGFTSLELGLLISFNTLLSGEEYHKY